jgi:hypothetical protein
MNQRSHQETRVIAAARAGISVRTAARLEEAPSTFLAPPPPVRSYRTRADPFAEVWQSDLVPLLTKCPDLHAATLLRDLQQRYPGQYPDRLQRTLQRRIQHWLGVQGPDRPVMFPQIHPPGEMGITDFTVADELQITFAGEAFPHRLFHFRLACSGWEAVSVVLGGESFPALAEGLRQALSELGGIPRTHRTDSLSAAYKNLTSQEDFTASYEQLCRHYGMQPTRNNRGQCHENGSIEGPNGHLKRRLDQSLLLRGSRDFPDLPAYRFWIQEQVASINARKKSLLEAELPTLLPLPAHDPVTWQSIPVTVTTFSTIVVRRAVYSVPSRLTGLRLMIHLYDDRLECFLASSPVITLVRIRAKPGAPFRHVYAINYRHIIGSLVRKPAAFRNLVYRDVVHPSPIFRRAWEAIDAAREPRQACREYVGILALAHEQACEHALGDRLQAILDTQGVPCLAVLRTEFEKPPEVQIPDIAIIIPDLEEYDDLFDDPSWSITEELTV